MVKALFINGSPRKNFNTAQLLQKAMEGAREAGAEVEMVNLYDRNLNYKGCMSCFACKVKGGKKGVCSFPDDLKPIMERAMEADVLVCGSPVYCGYPTAGLRAFMERLIFPAVNYADFLHPVINKPKRSATIFTMNCPDEEMYRANNYHILMDTNAHQLGMSGPTPTSSMTTAATMPKGSPPNGRPRNTVPSSLWTSMPPTTLAAVWWKKLDETR